MPTGAEIRQQFIDFFVKKCGHTFVPSSPVVPHDDPTLLFANAGMNQFKTIFLGQVSPTSPFRGLTRAVNSQKCIRAGGKHNDLDDVGKDTYHHTFFEMLGNWSFGDYFKEEAIEYSWALLTQVWRLDPERLYATYFEGDKAQGLAPDREAYDIWCKYLPPSRVLPGNMKDNFWEMGDTGPCGPCSEIHYDGRPDSERLDPKKPGYNEVNTSNPDVIEIWNNVFIQFNRTGPGGDALKPLPAKHVDTGMGLERITRIIQGKTSNYDTDLFTPLFARIQSLIGGAAYAGTLEGPRDIAYRVVADHARTLTFALTDGAVPGNEGRGYVLRRILRRAFFYGRVHMGAKGVFLCEIVPTIVEHFGGFFPELRKDPKRVAGIIREEEESFARTIDRGMALFDEAAGRGGKFIAPPDAFQLHDTYGFPIDLTEIMAAERGMTVDRAGFEKLMEEARVKSRLGGKPMPGASANPTSDTLALSGDEVAKLAKLNIKPTDDSDKFHARPIRVRIKAIWNGADFDETIDAPHTNPEDRFGLVLDKSNLYAEMGGQVGDAGVLRWAGTSGTGSSSSGEFIVEATRAFGGYILHSGRIKSGRIKVGDEGELKVDMARREPVMANHTATHLLNWALRETSGEGLDQKGSLVAPDRLRFDFASGGAIGDEAIAKIDDLVRAKIAANLEVHAAPASLEEARKIAGLRAVFGEAYPDPVRIVSIGRPVEALLRAPASPDNRAYSVEFCGGTHVASTGAIRAFTITHEEPVAKGVRRVTALTGVAAEAAIEAGHRLLERCKSAALRHDADLHAEVTEIGVAAQTLTIPATFRKHTNVALAQLQERVKGAQKKASAGLRETAVEAARLIADKAPEADRVIIARLPEGCGSDRAAMLGALDTIRAKRSHAAVLLIASTDDGKVTVVAGSPEALIAKGLKAGDWVRVASEACGGKGGGKPDTAQGGGTDPAKIPLAIDTAAAFAASKVS